MGISDDFADRFTTFSASLVRYEGSVQREILGFLHLLGTELETMIRDADLDGVSRKSFKFKRMEALLQEVKGTIAASTKAISKTMDGHLLDLSSTSSNFALKAVNDVIGANVLTTALTPRDLKVLVSNTLIEGAPSKEWWSKQDTKLQDAFTRQMRMGVALGETNDQLVRRIRGAKTGSRVVTIDGKEKRVPVYSNGIMDVSTREAEALVRTSVQAISNETLEQTYRENPDTIKGIQALVTLDGRTTLTCISRSGGAWDLETGDPLPESTVDIPYPGHPPWHWQCRTTIIPITYSWEELIERANNPKGVKLKKTVPKTTQSSMDGQVSGNLTYEQWLKTKDEAFQQEVLGKTKWDMWQRGDLTVAQMVDQTGRPLRIEEIREKFGIAKLEGPDGLPIEPVATNLNAGNRLPTHDPKYNEYRASINNATNVVDIEEALRNHPELGDIIFSSMDDIPLDVAKEVAHGVLDVGESFGKDAMRKFKVIQIGDADGGFAAMSTGGTLKLDKTNFSDLATLNRTTSRLKNKGWLVSDSPRSVIHHEMAHYLDIASNAARDLKTGKLFEDAASGFRLTNSQTFVIDNGPGLQTTISTRSDHPFWTAVSNYSATNTWEAYAELFSGVMNTPASSRNPVLQGFADALRLDFEANKQAIPSWL